MNKIKRPNNDEYMISTSDTLFKAIVQNPKFRKSLCLILDEVTDYSFSFLYENLKFINTELSIENKNERNKITDVLATITGGIINIEINRFSKKSSASKNNLYHHKIAYSKYFKGDKTSDLEIIQINFNVVKKFGNKLYECFTLKNEDGKYLDEENFKRVHINMANPLKKFYNSGKESLTKVEKIIVLFQLISKKEVKDLAKGDEDLEVMAKIIDDLNEDENIIGLYDKEEMEAWMHSIDLKEAKEKGITEGRKTGFEEGVAEGRETGFEEGLIKGKAEGIAEGKAEGIAEGKAEGMAEGKIEGIKESKIEIAKKMLDKNVEIKEISEITGLSITEIQNLKKEM